jgi:flagellar biosynthesis chaperone FliJ
LEKKKLQEVEQCARLTRYRKMKSDALSKIILYRAEYEKDTINPLSKEIPALMTNRREFLRKLEMTIQNEQDIIARLDVEINEYVKKIAALDGKVKAVEIIKSNHMLKKAVRNENIEANMLDDISNQLKLRS